MIRHSEAYILKKLEKVLASNRKDECETIS